MVSAPRRSGSAELRPLEVAAPARTRDTENQSLLASAATVAEQDFAQELAEGNARWRSWREKLDFARGLLVRDKPVLTPDLLADLAIYLRFLGTGEIACVEDGRHFRPAHHARIASQIQERLASLTTPQNVFIVRKILPWLPSSAPAFQRPEPLTRIRDIAHRNDIDPELKREIKTTLQNKLHRCAGPEDIASSAAILGRITAPGTNYSREFVEQFRIFHEELKEFFNARSLDDRLMAILPVVDAAQADLIRLFQRRKAEASPAGMVGAFETLTSLRQGFLAAARERPANESQEYLLADIALEDHAFVLLSEIVNACEKLPAETAWGFETNALIHALRNLALSSVVPGECEAVRAEFQAWGRITSAATREEVLRIKATTLRGRRLAEDFTNQIVESFSGRAEKLGRALGVAEHAIRVFAESDIRGHLVFQVSKLLAALLRRIRERLGLPAWDVLVSGRAVGRVRTVSTLEEIERGLREPLLVLAKSAAGDEEFPSNVAGIVLAQEMPHLSHLGVRARQAGIVLVSCQEPGEFEPLQKLDGQMVSIVASPEKVMWEKAAAPGQTSTAIQRPAPRIPAVRLEARSSWLPIEKAAPENAGGKAAATRRLAELGRKEGMGFHTPVSMVIPFGVMEAALAAEPNLATEYSRLVQQINEVPASEFAAAACNLRSLIEQLAVPDAVVSEALRLFGENARLAVRSSANCEDLEELAGAGLYDSVINVTPAEMACRDPHGLVIALDSARRAQPSASRHPPRAGAHGRARAGLGFAGLLVRLAHGQTRSTMTWAKFTPRSWSAWEKRWRPRQRVEVPIGLTCSKNSDAVSMLAFANFSQALRPIPEGGVQAETLNYSHIELSRDARSLDQPGTQTGRHRAGGGDRFWKTAGYRGRGGCRQDFFGAGAPAAGPGGRKGIISMFAQSKVMTLGLFEKSIEGDDSLMVLARQRFQQAGMGAEMHAGTPEELERLLSFRPSEETPVIVHLPRDFNLAEEAEPDGNSGFCDPLCRPDFRHGPA